MWAVLQRKVRQLGATLDGQARRLQVEGDEERLASQEDAAGDDCASGSTAGDDAGADGNGASGGEEALSLLARKAERERQMKRERSRLAFNSLFGAARTASPKPSTPAMGSASTPVAASAHTTTPNTVDLTADAGDAASKDTDGRSASVSATAGSAADSPLQGWFAMSALTGRVHAFGDGDAPLAAGLGASALPHELLDDDSSGLPPPLRSQCP